MATKGPFFFNNQPSNEKRGQSTREEDNVTRREHVDTGIRTMSDDLIKELEAQLELFQDQARQFQVALHGETMRSKQLRTENKRLLEALEMLHDAVVYKSLSEQKAFVPADDAQYLQTQIDDLEVKYGANEEPEQFMDAAMTKATLLFVYDKDGNKHTQAQKGGDHGGK